MKKPTERKSEQSRRSFVKTAVWVAPAILTLKATPAFAKLGSNRPGGVSGSQPGGGVGEQGHAGGSQQRDGSEKKNGGGEKKKGGHGRGHQRSSEKNQHVDHVQGSQGRGRGRG
jgi:hypothetical protein